MAYDKKRMSLDLIIQVTYNKSKSGIDMFLIMNNSW